MENELFNKEDSKIKQLKNESDGIRNYKSTEIGVFIKDRAMKERYQLLIVSLESVEVKLRLLRSLARLKCQFIKITKDLTTQERSLVNMARESQQEKRERPKQDNCNSNSFFVNI